MTLHSAEKFSSDDAWIRAGRRVLSVEIEALQHLESRLDAAFADACRRLLACTGRVVCTGMGKSGHVANKIAATLASTGTPAFYVHPGEASHGDLGMITKNDVVLALSNSGNTAEVITLLPLIKRLGIPLVSMTGDTNSALAQAAVANLDVGIAEEACPLNLAPTTSTTVTLVMGDALAIALLESRGFSAEDFAFDCVLDELTFRYYNCVPQNPKMNRGPWKKVETQIREVSQNRELFIICINIFGNNYLKNTKVGIPTECIKLVYDTKSMQPITGYIFTNTSEPKFLELPPNNIIKLKNLNIDFLIKK